MSDDTNRRCSSVHRHVSQEIEAFDDSFVEVYEADHSQMGIDHKSQRIQDMKVSHRSKLPNALQLELKDQYLQQNREEMRMRIEVKELNLLGKHQERDIDETV